MDLGRTLTASAVLVCLAAALRASRGTQDGAAAERPPHQQLDRPSAQACGGCHPRELDEWSRSLHGRAWTNANARAATREFTKVECRPCHSPLPVLLQPLDEPPDYRDFNQVDGVQCLACHGLAEGVAATRTIEGAPCSPRAEPRLSSTELCYPCHEPTHQAFAEFRTSRAAAEGRRCTDCHMPERADGSGRSHGAHGGFDEEFVKSALRWEAEVVDTPGGGREIALTLTNLAAHKFPGEIPSRSFLVRVEPQGHEPLTTLLRKPNKGEERADDRLLPDETRVLRYPLADGVEHARLQLFFLPLPLLPPEEGFLLGEWVTPGK